MPDLAPARISRVLELKRPVCPFKIRSMESTFDNFGGRYGQPFGGLSKLQRSASGETLLSMSHDAMLRAYALCIRFKRSHS